MMINDKKGAFKITVDLKKVYKLKTKLLQNVNSKCYSKNFRFYKIFSLTILFSDPFIFYNSQLGLLINPDLFNNSIASRQSQAISFHLISMINQVI